MCYDGRHSLRRIIVEAKSALLLTMLIGPVVSFGQAEDERTPAQSNRGEEVTPGNESDSNDCWSRSFLTGDWGGKRTALEERGITLNLEYVSTAFGNLRGGLNTNHAVEYTGNTHLTLSLNTEALKWWDGGEVFVYVEERHGSGITERHVGDLFALNNDEDRDFLQVSEYWWRQSFLNGKAWLKIGKMDASADFQVAEYGLEFINSAFTGIPNVPVPTFPDDALGLTVHLQPVDAFYVMAGVFDQNAYGGTSGFDTAFHDRADTVSFLEAAVMTEREVNGRTLPGTYRVGGWYASGTEDRFFNDLDGRLPGRSHSGNHGFYVVLDQLLYKENAGVDDAQGIGGFLQFGWAPPAYNEINTYYGAGLQWTGAIPGLDDDIMGFAVGHGSLSDRVQSLESRYSETAIEWFYKAQVTPWLSVMPDVQYIVNPGGDGRDALVVGLRTQISF